MSTTLTEMAFLHDQDTVDAKSELVVKVVEDARFHNGLPSVRISRLDIFIRGFVTIQPYAHFLKYVVLESVALDQGDTWTEIILHSCAVIAAHDCVVTVTVLLQK